MTRSKGKQSKDKGLILVGLLVIVIAMFLIKQAPQDSTAASLPEDLLAEALENGLPAMVFFHSTSCDPCIAMVENVNQAFPEFKESITLIDVNVSDERNHNLLRSQDVRLIPSLKFFGQDGQSWIVYGVITPDQIREELKTLLEH